MPTFISTEMISSLNKSAVGLSNVDNTSDVNKPVSTAVQNALDTKASTATVTTTANGLMIFGDKVKLNSIAAGATLNSTDSQLRDRTTHTGTQAVSTISGLQTILDSKAPLISPLFIGTTSIAKLVLGPPDPSLDNAKQWVYSTAGPDTYTTNVRSDFIAGGTGGTFGFVSANARFFTQVGAGRQDFVWGGIFQIDNYCETSGEPTALYVQTNRMTTTTKGGWGLTVEHRDKSGSSPNGPFVTVEMDCFANGLDPTNSRVVQDIVIGKGLPGGSQCEAGFGIRITTQDGNTNNGRIKKAITIDNIDVDCGFDTSLATFNSGGPAYRLGLNQYISFTSVNDRTLGYTSSGLQYKVAGSAVFTLSDSKVIARKIRLVDLVNASDDTQAASFGVEVNEVYRNGSSLMIRVS